MKDVNNLKICVLNPVSLSQKGGVERFISNFKNVFKNSYIEVLSYDELKQRYKFLKLFPFFEHPARAFYLDLYFLLKKCYKHFDILLINSMFGWLFYFLRPPIFIVNVFHTTDAGFAQHLKRKSKLTYLKLRYIYSFFQKLSCKSANICIAVSEKIKNEIKKYFKISKAMVIHNCIDLEMFKPIDKKEARNKLNLPYDKKIGLFVGRVEFSKGDEILFRIIQQLKDILFVIVTSSNLKLKSHNVKVFSNIAFEEMPLFYSACDFLILPSYYESFSFAILEALACNLPVIAYKNAVIPEFAKYPIGVIVKKQNPQEYIKAIDYVLNNKFENLRKIAENFSLTKFKKNYENLFRKILKIQL